MGVLNGTHGKQYAPPEQNPNYLQTLNAMKSAQRWINDYSNGYSRNYQYGGVVRPFSYGPIPVVRYGKGGNLFQGKKSFMPRLINNNGKSYLTNDYGTFLPEVNITTDAPDWVSTQPLPEDPRNTRGIVELNGTYYLNGVPTGEIPL
jgi:hypothetical protein